jgi:hypothetical protein
MKDSYKQIIYPLIIAAATTIGVLISNYHSAKLNPNLNYQVGKVSCSANRLSNSLERLNKRADEIDKGIAELDKCVEENIAEDKRFMAVIRDDIKREIRSALEKE